MLRSGALRLKGRGLVGCASAVPMAFSPSAPAPGCCMGSSDTKGALWVPKWLPGSQNGTQSGVFARPRSLRVSKALTYLSRWRWRGCRGAPTGWRDGRWLPVPSASVPVLDATRASCAPRPSCPGRADTQTPVSETAWSGGARRAFWASKWLPGNQNDAQSDVIRVLGSRRPRLLVEVCTLVTQGWERGAACVKHGECAFAGPRPSRPAASETALTRRHDATSDARTFVTQRWPRGAACVKHGAGAIARPRSSRPAASASTTRPRDESAPLTNPTEVP
jgi:hypothetical protein